MDTTQGRRASHRQAAPSGQQTPSTQPAHPPTVHRHPVDSPAGSGAAMVGAATGTAAPCWSGLIARGDRISAPAVGSRREASS